MNFKFMKWLAVTLLITVVSVNSWAAGTVNCFIDPAPTVPLAFSSTYVFGSTTGVTVNVPVKCTQTGANGNNPVPVIVTVAVNNGSQPVGNQNKAVGAGSINYDFYTGSGCTTETHDINPSPPSVTLTINSKNGSITGNVPVYGCLVPAPAASASGLYSDTATARIAAATDSSGNNSTSIDITPVSFPVRITLPERCSITMSASPLTFAYTSFSNNASQASILYSVACGSSIVSPINMFLTDGSGTTLSTGTAAGLNYTLALNKADNSAANATTLTVTPGLPNYRINGNMVAGQAGSCAAPAVQAGSTCTQTVTGVHYLTVTW